MTETLKPPPSSLGTTSATMPLPLARLPACTACGDEDAVDGDDRRLVGATKQPKSCCLGPGISTAPRQDLAATR